MKAFILRLSKHWARGLLCVSPKKPIHRTVYAKEIYSHYRAGNGSYIQISTRWLQNTFYTIGLRRCPLCTMTHCDMICLNPHSFIHRNYCYYRVRQANFLISYCNKTKNSKDIFPYLFYTKVNQLKLWFTSF